VHLAVVVVLPFASFVRKAGSYAQFAPGMPEALGPRHLFRAPDVLRQPRQRRAVTAAATIASLIAGAVVMAFVVGQVVRALPGSAAHPSLLEQKLNYIQTTSDRFDVLFIGTSHVYRGIDHSSFDATVASHGPTVRSLNLGIAGMTLWEMEQLVGALERRGMLGARTVVLEALYVDVNPDNWANDRTMAVQDVNTTSAIIKYSFAVPAKRRWTISGACRSPAVRGSALLRNDSTSVSSLRACSLTRSATRRPATWA
jgi:hypothetical protein